jgi:hypothetical protein
MSAAALFLAIALREIRVQPGAANAPWRVTYTFSQPVARVELERNGTYRRKEWRAETAGYTFADNVIKLDEGAAPRKSVTVAFPPDFSHPEKDYQLFERYSEGSVLLYTGHFNVAGAKNRFVLTPRRGEHLIVAGRVFRRRTTWTDDDGEGTFVYYGKLKPVATPDMIAVIDPGAPPWLRKRLDDGVPRLFADYAALTGYKLETRPTVFFSFEAARDPNSTTWKGGTLPGVIQMAIETARDAAEDGPLLERFFKFLAHEAAHMWNGQLFHAPERGQSWMHEGGGDAFAWRALRRADLLDDRQLAARETGDLNQCLAEVGSAAVDDAEAKGNFKAVYACGSALAWLTEAAVHRADASADLFTFWKALFRAADSRGRKYDEALYLSVLKDRADAASVQFIDDFVHRPMPDHLQRIIAVFADEGIVLEPKPEAIPMEQRQAWAQSALVALMGGDCGGHVNLWRRSGKIILGGDAKCATLRSELAVGRVEDHDINREGEVVYDAVAARCAAHEVVALDAGGTRVEVPCTVTLAPRTPWLAVKR